MAQNIHWWKMCLSIAECQNILPTKTYDFRSWNMKNTQHQKLPFKCSRNPQSKVMSIFKLFRNVQFLKGRYILGNDWKILAVGTCAVPKSAAIHVWRRTIFLLYGSAKALYQRACEARELHQMQHFLTDISNLSPDNQPSDAPRRLVAFFVFLIWSSTDTVTNQNQLHHHQ